MKLLLCLGIHALLMLFYAVAVEYGYSRMHWKHLLLALLFPYAGEMCLLIAEQNYIPSNPLYVSPFKRQSSCERHLNKGELPDDWQERIHGNEEEARTFLLEMIGSYCDGLILLLHEALHAQSSEVCHIAAITLMKLRSRYEKNIIIAQQQLESNKGNVQNLKAVIDSIDAYRISGLNDGELLCDIRQEEIDFIEQYLSVRREDTEYRRVLIELLLQEKSSRAVEQSKRQLELIPDAVDSWELALRACHAAGMNDQVKELLHRMHFCNAFRSADGMIKLEELERSYGQKT